MSGNRTSLTAIDLPNAVVTQNWAYSVGFWTAVAVTTLGVGYLLAILFATLTGGMVLPPPGWLQTVGGVVSLLACPLLIAMMASLHVLTPSSHQAFSLVALCNTVLFATAVSINRFTQFGAVRQSRSAGATNGIEWFLPYGERSVMLGLEIMGWGWFLGLALLAAAPLFSGNRRGRWLRALCLLYSVLGIVAAIGYLLESPITAVGFVAWGLILFLITGLLAIDFWRTAART